MQQRRLGDLHHKVILNTVSSRSVLHAHPLRSLATLRAVSGQGTESCGQRSGGWAARDQCSTVLHSLVFIYRFSRRFWVAIHICARVYEAAYYIRYDMALARLIETTRAAPSSQSIGLRAPWLVHTARSQRGLPGSRGPSCGRSCEPAAEFLRSAASAARAPAREMHGRASRPQAHGPAAILWPRHACTYGLCQPASPRALYLHVPCSPPAWLRASPPRAAGSPPITAQGRARGFYGASSTV